MRQSGTAGRKIRQHLRQRGALRSRGVRAFSVVSTASSDGAVNSSHDSFTPLAGLAQMFNLKSGEVIFGGTGSGLASMLLLVLVTVFIPGLMVGRTPEYLGKKIENKEIKLVMLSLVATGAAMLFFSAASLIIHFSPASTLNAPGAPIENLGNPGRMGSVSFYMPTLAPSLLTAVLWGA